jgi:hypothetical protein
MFGIAEQCRGVFDKWFGLLSPLRIEVIDKPTYGQFGR